MELNKEQIIKALECCIKAECWGDCQELGCPALTKNGCHFYLRTDDDNENALYIEMLKDALALINSQEERIKELTEEKAEIWEERNRIYNDLQDWKAIAEGYQKQFEDCAEDRAKLTEENERLRGVGIPDNEVYIRLSDAKHAIMEYACNQTVSKYASAEICKAVRNGAEGAMNELDYITPVKVAPIADTVRKMQAEIEARCIKGGIYPAFVKSTIDQIAEELISDGT